MKDEFGYLCSYFPVEVPLALGLRPVRLLPEKVPETGRGLPAFFCAPARSYLNAALAGRYAHLVGVGVTHACDAMQCLAQVWKERVARPPLHILRLPSRRDPAALDAATNAMRDLVRRMPHPVRTEALAAATGHARTVRANTAMLFRCRGRVAPLAVWDQVVQAWHHPHHPSPDRLAHGAEERQQPSDGDAAITGDAGRTMRVVIAGSILASPHLLLAVTEAGGTVVGDDICTLERGLSLPDVDTPETDVCRALAGQYLAMPPCPCRHPGPEARLRHLSHLVREREAQGVILLQEKFCEPHRWEQPAISRGLRRSGTAVLELEWEATAIPGERERTRVQALLESLARGT